MYLYIFKTKGAYKIGISENVNKRLITVNRGCPFPVSKVFDIELDELEAIAVESSIHKKLRFSNISGEWFFVSDDKIEELIQTIKTINPLEVISDNQDSELRKFINDERLDIYDKTIITYIYVNNNPVSDLSVEEFKNNVGISLACFRRSIKKLSQLGIVTTDDARNSKKVYTLHI